MALLLLGSWISGCATLNPGPRRENFAPLFLYSEDEKKEGKALDILGPFFTYRKNQQEKDVAFRPLFYSKTEPARYRLDYLYPMGGYERTEQREHSYFHLIYSTNRDLTLEPTPKKERSFLLAFWGATDKGEPYGGFFPLYGNLKKRFGRDEMNFFLWPLYSNSRQGESRAYSFLWPIFSYYGGDREGFKIWPLGGYDRKENDYRKTFFLWPIFDFEKRYLNTDEPQDINMVWPLYVSFSTSKQVYRSTLWPLFAYTYDDYYSYTQWDFPWPFFQWGKGEERSLFRIFPIYSRYYWRGLESGYILFPVYWYSHTDDDEYRHTTDRYLLLSKNEIEVWKKEDQRERRLRIWPFFYYRQGKKGNVFLYWPCIVPVDFEGFEQNWIPFTTLYEYRRDPEGDSESKFLWGVYVHRQNPSRELYELSFFLTYYTAEDLVYFSLLKGLLEYRGDGSRHALRVLYSPWPMEWESSSARSGGKNNGVIPTPAGIQEKNSLLLLQEGQKE